MSDSKHTPGPWHVGKNGVQTWKRGIFAGPSMVAEAVGYGYPMGEGWAPESEANAALIAAAPDLLAALRQFVEMKGRVPKNDPNTIFIDYRSWQAFQSDARAAIAKAEGR